LISKKRFAEEVGAGKRPPKAPRKKKQNPAVPSSERAGQPCVPDPDFKVLTVEEIRGLGKVERPVGPQPPEPGDQVSPTLT
jgi:hypothetical protein